MTFSLRSDDSSLLWVGATAVSGYTVGNALVNNGGVHAVSPKSNSIVLSNHAVYFMRLMYGQFLNGYSMVLSYQLPGSATARNTLDPPLFLPTSIPTSSPTFHAALDYSVVDGYFNGDVNYFSSLAGQLSHGLTASQSQGETNSILDMGAGMKGQVPVHGAYSVNGAYGDWQAFSVQWTGTSTRAPMAEDGPSPCHRTTPATCGSDRVL